MPLGAPDISPAIRTNTTCDGLLFTDATVYTGSDITSSQVATATIRLDYSTLGTYIQYVFTISNNVISSATLSLAGATPVSITTYIDDDTISDVFPFVDLDLTAYYGVTIPTVEDGVFYTSYRVHGTNNGESFSYTGTEEIINSCAVCCCISNLFANLDPNCACSDSSWMKAMRAQAYLTAARYAGDVGNIDNAVASLNLATEICSGNCGCGG